MSIENSLTSIAKSLEIIAVYISTTKNVQTATIETTKSTPTIAAVSVPAVTVSAPVSPSPVVTAVAAPVVAVPVVTAPVAAMPAVPVFTPAAATPSTPASVAAAPVLPSAFKDKQAMMDFVIASYKSLGAEKGAKIQDVLTAMGYANINDVPEAQWGQLKVGIEGLAK